MNVYIIATEELGLTYWRSSIPWNFYRLYIFNIVCIQVFELTRPLRKYWREQNRLIEIGRCSCLLALRLVPRQVYAPGSWPAQLLVSYHLLHKVYRETGGTGPAASAESFTFWPGLELLQSRPHLVEPIASPVLPPYFWSTTCGGLGPSFAHCLPIILTFVPSPYDVDLLQPWPHLRI